MLGCNTSVTAEPCGSLKRKSWTGGNSRHSWQLLSINTPEERQTIHGWRKSTKTQCEKNGPTMLHLPPDVRRDNVGHSPTKVEKKMDIHQVHASSVMSDPKRGLHPPNKNRVLRHQKSLWCSSNMLIWRNCPLRHFSSCLHVSSPSLWLYSPVPNYSPDPDFAFSPPHLQYIYPLVFTVPLPDCFCSSCNSQC